MRQKLRFETLERKEMLAADVGMNQGMSTMDPPATKEPSAVFAQVDGGRESMIGAIPEDNFEDVFRIIRDTPNGDRVIRILKKRLPSLSDSSMGGNGGEAQGAEVNVVERDTETILSITLPNGRKIIREVGKKEAINDPGDGNVTLTTGTVAVEPRDNTVTVELQDGHVIRTSNGHGLLTSGQIEAGDEVDVLVKGDSDPGNGPIESGTIKVEGSK